MKKYFSVLIFVMIFTAFLAVQIIFDRKKAPVNFSDRSNPVVVSLEKSFKELNLKTIDDEIITPSLLKSKIVILKFWASWCLPCLSEIPSLVQLKKRFTDKEIMVLGINEDQGNQVNKIRKMIKKFDLNFPIIADDGSLSERFRVSSLPFALIYKNGNIIDIVNGAKDYNSEEVIEYFKQILIN